MTPRKLLIQFGVIALAATIPWALRAQQITIRILDAHNGRAMAHEPIAVRRCDGIRIHSPDRAKLAPDFWTDASGNAIVPLRPGDNGISLIESQDIPCEPHPIADPNLNFRIATLITNHELLASPRQ